MRMILAAAVVVLFSACARDEGTGILGTSADLTIPPGTYMGYRVVYPCPVSPSLTLSVDGLGSVSLPDTASISRKGNELYANLRDLSSVWGGGGAGLACESGVGTTLYMNDWRDVDEVITRTGAFLHDNDLDLAVTVAVTSIPVAD